MYSPYGADGGDAVWRVLFDGSASSPQPRASRAEPSEGREQAMRNERSSGAAAQRRFGSREPAAVQPGSRRSEHAAIGGAERGIEGQPYTGSRTSMARSSTPSRARRLARERAGATWQPIGVAEGRGAAAASENWEMELARRGAARSRAGRCPAARASRAGRATPGAPRRDEGGFELGNTRAELAESSGTHLERTPARWRSAFRRRLVVTLKLRQRGCGDAGEMSASNSLPRPVLSSVVQARQGDGRAGVPPPAAPG